MNIIEPTNYYQYFTDTYLKKDDTLFKFGSIGDGGYFLKPETIKKCDLLFSGGISSNLEFEFDFFRFNTEANILMIDPTVSRFKLLAKGIARLFFKKINKIRYLYNTLIFWDLLKSDRCKHLNLWLNAPLSLFKLIRDAFGDKHNIILKLDIEGSEYDFFEEILNNQDDVLAMVFEFHDLDKNYNKLNMFFKEISKTFNLAHIEQNPSGGFKNNQPKCIEVSFERK